ncbi:HD domain-containing protein [Microbacteriaceae bacterium VKM Ac-2855]|nr:HD domain-containing protein [Microbacteriaceae bacterium VKM Ac-2855]
MTDAALRALGDVAITGAPLDDELRRRIRERRAAVREIAKAEIWAETVRILTRGRHFGVLFAELRATGWIELLPELEAALDVPQDPRWHAEGPVGVHLALAGEAAAAAAADAGEGLDERDRVLAVGGALLHDLGKAVATQIHHDADGTVIRISSHGHDSAGAPLAAALLRRLGAPASVSEPIAAIVREHMMHVVGAPTARAARRVRARLAQGGATLAQWARVVDADLAGRGPSARPSPSAAWLRAAGELD